MNQTSSESASPEPWHQRSVEQVLDAVASHTSGLSDEQVHQRLAEYGPNQLPRPPGRSAWMRFLIQFHNVLIYVLLGAAAITMALGHYIDTGVILAVVLANAVIGYIQEGKAEKAMEAIRHMLAPSASVIRNGERHSVPGEQLVPGDIVLLEAGDRVPADLRLLRCHGLQAQEAILTGESVAVDKTTEPVVADAPLGDRCCMAYSGTLVTSGQGRGVVVATGAHSEIGRISGLLSTVETLSTPLVQQMGVFGKWLTLLILSLSVLILAYGYYVQHHAFDDIFLAVVGLAVAAIPEGLPAVLTITLAVGVQAMARRNAIVRRLPAIETLGSVSVICTDKTGTLTLNEMTVASIVTRNHRFEVTGNGYSPEGAVTLDGQPVDLSQHPHLRHLAHAAVLCNDAAIREQDGVWTVKGDPMEGALIACAAKLGLQRAEAERDWNRTDTIPFDAKHRFMATLHHDHSRHACIFVKGAPEQIVQMCRQQFAHDGASEPLDADFWNESAEALAGEGQRVLAFALMPVRPEHTVLEFSDLKGELALLGFVGLIDPPRPEAIAAVAECRGAGIRVKMITGDHAGTAAAIAQRIGLQNTRDVLTGAQLEAMDDSRLSQVVVGTDIFARTSPEHKLRLVMALQAHGISVGMTGDGVNDAPALKRADTGIAMGKKGSEAAKEAAELVLADDNFASIAAAVREGRTVYDNIKKVISWTLPTNASEGLTIVVALLLGLTLPVTPVQILWVNMITAVTLGIALAFEPTEPHTMRRPPRPRNEPLLNGVLAWQIVLVSALFLCGVFGIYSYAIDRGHSLELARTMVTNTLVVMEIFYLFFIRNLYDTSLNWKALLGTRVVWVSVSVVTVAQFGFTYLPPVQKVFATEAVPLFDGLLIVAVGLAMFVIIEIEKQIRLRMSPGQIP